MYPNGTAFYKDDINIYATYELVSPTEINLTKCYSPNRCETRDITIDPEIGKITISGNYFFVRVYSSDPIII